MRHLCHPSIQPANLPHTLTHTETCTWKNLDAHECAHAPGWRKQSECVAAQNRCCERTWIKNRTDEQEKCWKERWSAVCQPKKSKVGTYASVSVTLNFDTNVINWVRLCSSVCLPFLSHSLTLLQIWFAVCPKIGQSIFELLDDWRQPKKNALDRKFGETRPLEMRMNKKGICSKSKKVSQTDEKVAAAATEENWKKSRKRMDERKAKEEKSRDSCREGSGRKGIQMKRNHFKPPRPLADREREREKERA